MNACTRMRTNYIAVNVEFMGRMGIKSILSNMVNPDLTMSDAHWKQVENLKEILSYPFV